jgi:putative ABC transport system permease protein
MSDVVALIGALKKISLAVFVVMLLIIMVGITNSYRMVVLERISEIGTLRAMGAQRSWIFRLFMTESVITALMGASGGVVGAVLMSLLLGTLTIAGGGPLSMFTVTGHLQFPLSVISLSASLVVTALVAAAAVYFPARKAANMAPGDALRAAA